MSGIPEQRPGDDGVRAIAKQALLSNKGAGWAARLFEECGVAELPATVVGFLKPSLRFLSEATRPCSSRGEQTRRSRCTGRSVPNTKRRAGSVNAMIEICPDRQRLLDCEGHALVIGGPGSGKTTIALKKAVKRIDEGLAPGQSVLFLSFSRAAVARIGEASKTGSRKEPAWTVGHPNISLFFSGSCCALMRIY